MKKRRAPARGQDFWHGHIHAWLASGLSKPDYCNRHGLSVKSFYRWDWMRRKVEPNAVKNVPLIPLIATGDESAPASAASVGTSAGIRIHVRDQFVVDLAVGFDAASLERLWKTWG
ncbi:MAG: IS66 family insertion sequence element accessory protein TnpA [Sphingomonadaceae bacterium]